MTLLPAVLILAAALSPTPPATPAFPGTWVYHEPWQEKPPGVGSGSHAAAVVLRFCPSGAFLLVKGVLYRSEASISFGSDDGLEIWAGRWQASGGRLTMTYRLRSYEIPFTGAEEATRNDVHAQAIPEPDRLVFAVPGTRGLRRFEPAAALPGALAERFLECKPESNREPAPSPPRR